MYDGIPADELDAAIEGLSGEDFDVLISRVKSLPRNNGGSSDSFSVAGAFGKGIFLRPMAER